MKHLPEGILYKTQDLQQGSEFFCLSIQDVDGRISALMYEQ